MLILYVMTIKVLGFPWSGAAKECTESIPHDRLAEVLSLYLKKMFEVTQRLLRTPTQQEPSCLASHGKVRIVVQDQNGFLTCASAGLWTICPE